jgi:hypothetical protein
MGSMKNWMLGAAVMVGGLGLATVPAHAAQFGIYVGGGQAAYIPPCPGPGYSWVAGYMSDGYWIPGRWAFTGYADGYGYGYGDGDGDRFEHFDRDRGWDRGRGWNREDDRHFGYGRGDYGRGWRRHEDDH